MQKEAEILTVICSAFHCATLPGNIELKSDLANSLYHRD
jgi:hypothetical protein